MTVKNETPRHSDFYISTVTFLVEDSLFRVSREPFQKESEVFCDMFSLPQGSSVVVEGTSDESPVRIDRISKDDFEQLLKALFHRKYGSQLDLPHGIEQWTSVLKLSATWNFERLRQGAIDALIESGIGAIDRVVLSQRYYIKNWLLPALNELARRPEPITLEEAKRMGIDVALKLASVRERVTVTMPMYMGDKYQYSIKKNNCDDDDSSHRVSVGSCRDLRMQDYDFSEQIRSTFSEYEL
ncbi:hypothetical protein PISMIDRAFT_410337 [Pisolithus microcarpus 441]|uniref:BTB domain-containing protein n=1 Tax=Pisolithus microcarpus 441 TaxID=765257 RepID=A0A0C9ZXT8_9AGAM|nr:hypothetical protein PISMIDRAFT_410337 [Pisolithus microcarpus 441]